MRETNLLFATQLSTKLLISRDVETRGFVDSFDELIYHFGVQDCELITTKIRDLFEAALFR